MPTSSEPPDRLNMPPVQNSSRKSAQKSSPAATYQSSDRTPPYASRASHSPPPAGASRTSGSGNTAPLPHLRMADVYQKLKKSRERERKDAIKNGFLADPDKPTSLANAITPVGTCQDMCPQFERVERIVQNLVDGSERTISSAGFKEPNEDRMVKRFRRSAAGYDEQLPSDIRPPEVLQTTLDYLINEVVGGGRSLANVHKFVWDRTRGIRNDFSIQQVTRSEDLRIAIDCFERIARFHILSLHLLSDPDRENGDFDHHQEREQLNNTLLSLMYYYDDSRHKLTSPNEAEFRAYCIIFEIQDLRPDLEDRAQQWPRSLLWDRRVQIALKLYAAAGNTSDEQGPLRPRAAFAVAQAHTRRFFNLVDSAAVSYTMACVAEIYFDLVRRTSLEAIWKAYKGKRGGAAKIEDWGLESLTTFLGFDTEQQTQTYIEEHGFSVAEREDGGAFIDLGSVTSRHLSDSNPRRKQLYSVKLVEQKRLNRTLPAIIDGLSACEAQRRGCVHDAPDADTSRAFQGEPLFVSEDSDERPEDSSWCSRIMEETRPVPNSSMTPNTGAAATPTFSSEDVDTKRFSCHDGTFPSIFSTDKIKHGQASQFSFGKPPSITGQPALPTNSTLSPVPSGQHLSSQHSSLSNDANFGTEQGPSKSKVHSTDSLTKLWDSSQDAARPAAATTISVTNGSHAPILRPSFSQPGTPEGSMGGAKPRSPVSVEKGSIQLDDASPSSTYISKHDERIIPPIRSSQQLAPENPEASQRISSTEWTSLPHQTFPPAIKASFVGPQVYTTTAGIAKASSSSIKAHGPSTSSTLSASQPRASLGSTQDASLPATTDKQASFSADSEPIMRPTSEGISPVFWKDLDPRATVIDVLSKAVMHDDGGLIQQFVEYMARPSIANTIRQAKDERSWKQARICRSVLLIKKYSRLWKKNAWRLALLRKGRERRKNLAQSMRALARSADQSQTKPKMSTGLGQDNLVDGSLTRALGVLPASQLHSRRKSLPVDLDVAYPRTTDCEAPGNKRERHDSYKRPTVNSKRRKTAHHHRSNTVATHLQCGFQERGRADTARSLTGYQEERASHSPSLRTARALFQGRSDTTRTDYFRLKALGVDPDTPLIPRTARKRPRTNKLDKGEKRMKASTPFTSGSRDSASVVAEEAGIMTSLQPRSVTQEEGEQDDDSDEALLRQMRDVRDTMSESISWFIAERAKSQPAVSKNPRPDSKETAKQKIVYEFTSTPSRTEQRLRSTGAHGLLPKEWEVKSSWRDERGKISTSVAPTWSELKSASPPRPSPLLERERANADLAGRHVGAKKAAKEVEKAKLTTAAAAGSSVEDAIEL